MKLTKKAERFQTAIRMMDWSKNRVVARDVLDIHGQKYLLVSTVKLPFDHGWDGVEKWYETMVFDCDKDGNFPPVEEGSHDHWQSRYTTREEAQTGHDWLVQAILTWGDKWDVIEDQWRNRPTGQDLTA